MLLFSRKPCPALCDPMDYSLLRLLCPCNFPAKNPGVSCHFFLQRIFLTQGSNLHLLKLLHCRQILYQVQGEPQNQAENFI